MTMSTKVGRGMRALGALLVLLYGITPAHAQPTEMAQVRSAGEVKLRGTIEAIDLTARTVTIRGDRGSVVTIDVPQSVLRFEELKVGDVVSASYYDRVSVRPKPPGEAAVDRTEPPLRTQIPGALPGATVVSQRVATVTLTGWDPATRTVTFTGPKGAVYSRRLLDNADPSVVAGIKLGDRVDVTRTEAVNLGVESRTTVDATAAPGSEDGFRMGAFTFKPGGRIKLDIIRDFDPIGSEDSFDPRTIPVDGSEGTNSNIHARETRLSLDMRGPFEGRELRMYVEGDFYGSGNAFRLRQAFGSYGGLLAGQTWSVFVDENNFPNTIDFESPMAFPSIRQAQLRYTHKFGDKSSWAVGLEDNKSAIEPPANIAGKAEFPMPDVTAHVRLAGERAHVFASGFLGKARFRPEIGENDDVTLWGGMLSARAKTFGKDYVYGQLTFGDGIGRYRGGATAVPDENGNLQAVGVTGIMVGYDHYWTDRLTSNVVGSLATSSDESFYRSDFNKDLNYGAVNLLYWFLPNRAWAGVEYLYGRREVKSGESGTANRLQFAVRFNFPS